MAKQQQAQQQQATAAASRDPGFVKPEHLTVARVAPVYSRVQLELLFLRGKEARGRPALSAAESGILSGPTRRNVPGTTRLQPHTSNGPPLPREVLPARVCWRAQGSQQQEQQHHQGARHGAFTRHGEIA